MDNYKVNSERKRRREIKVWHDGTTEVLVVGKNKPRKSLINRGKIIAVARKVSKHVEENRKKYFIGTAAIAVGMVAVIAIVAMVLSCFPYAIEIDDEEICYVNGKLQGEKVIENILSAYVPEGTAFKAIDTADRFELARANIIGLDKSKLMSVNKATEYILDDFQTGENAIDITIASTKTTKKKYEPEPIYKKDKTMLAGESKVVKKGKAGKQKVTVTYISVNGKIKKHMVTAREILDKGKRATVKKGTLGLPDGADWKTFTGDPVFKDGKELATTALKYLGAPYKYGGTSLTHGIDCVQFVRQMYAKYGIHLSNSDVYHGGKSISLKNAKKGDIICYSNHVAIYIGDGKVVHALRKGVTVSKVGFRKVKSVRRIVN